jgi:hypothetical protein
VKVDTEVRTLGALFRSCQEQHRSMQWQMRSLPGSIERAQESLEKVNSDIALRDANPQEAFSMTVGKRVYSGTGAREEAAKALTLAALEWRDAQEWGARDTYRGFTTYSRGRETWKKENQLLPDDHSWDRKLSGEPQRRKPGRHGPEH